MNPLAIQMLVEYGLKVINGKPVSEIEAAHQKLVDSRVADDSISLAFETARKMRKDYLSK